METSGFFRDSHKRLYQPDEQITQSRSKKQKSANPVNDDHVNGQFKTVHEVAPRPQSPNTSRSGLLKMPEHYALGRLPAFPLQEKNILPHLPSIPDGISEVVFTHPSAIQADKYTRVDQCNDRLEFLGDAYIEIMASRLLFPLLAGSPVGHLSQQREQLVKNETLASYAVAYGFDRRLNVSSETRRLEAYRDPRWTKIMADVLEAYVAAVVISDILTGFQVAEQWLNALWQDKLEGKMKAEAKAVDMDAKQRLAQKVMSKGIKLEYKEEAREPNLKEGKTWFTMGVFLTGWGYKSVRLGGGRALKKQEAAQVAAMDALGQNLTDQINITKREYDRRNTEQRAMQRSGNELYGTTESTKDSEGEWKKKAAVVPKSSQKGSERRDGEISSSNKED